MTNSLAAGLGTLRKAVAIMPQSPGVYRMLDAAGEPLTLKGCLYSVTPDEDFIIDSVPGVPQAVFASCCSGHGFKFASAIGEILADLSDSGRSRFDLAPFSLARFAA